MSELSRLTLKLAGHYEATLNTILNSKPNVASWLKTTFGAVVNAQMKLKPTQNKLADMLGVERKDRHSSRVVLDIIDRLKEMNVEGANELEKQVQASHVFWSDPEVKQADQNGTDMDIARAAKNYSERNFDR